MLLIRNVPLCYCLRNFSFKCIFCLYVCLTDACLCLSYSLLNKTCGFFNNIKLSSEKNICHSHAIKDGLTFPSPFCTECLIMKQLHHTQIYCYYLQILQCVFVKDQNCTKLLVLYSISAKYFLGRMCVIFSIDLS